jgi:hypothetical protein
MSINAKPLARPRPPVHPRLGPWSRQAALSMLDGRSKEAMYMRRVRSELIAHLGGNPNAVQRHLIERVVRLSMHIELMDQRLFHSTGPTQKQSNEYLAWSNALGRTLARLGIDAAEPKATSLEDVLSDDQGEAA